MPAERLLVFGKDDFMKRRAVRAVRDRLFPPAAGGKNAGVDLNYREWDAEREGWADALDFLRTTGFLSEKRLAVLWGVEALEDEEGERLIKAAQELPGWATLVLETSESNTRKNKFLQSLSEITKPVACHTPFDRDLPAWVVIRAKETGFKLDHRSARLVVERLGKDLGALDGALETLCLFIHPRSEANPADITRLFSAWAETDVFGVLDRLLEGDAAQALATAHRVLEQGGKPAEMIAVLAGQLDRLLRAKNAMLSGKSALDAAQAAGVHPYFREKFAGQLRNLSSERLAGWLKGLLETDESIKSGVLPDRLALERFLSRESSAPVRRRL